MRIRPATPADIPAMMHMVKRSPTAAHWSREQYDRVFGGDAPRRAAWIVEAQAGNDSEPRLLGFLVAHEAAGEWEIENIAVEKSARGRGLGTQLLGEFLNRIRSEGATAVFLEVRDSNHAARSLYEKCNFEQTGRRSRYYSDPIEDAITYRLSLV